MVCPIKETIDRRSLHLLVPFVCLLPFFPPCLSAPLSGTPNRCPSTPSPAPAPSPCLRAPWLLAPPLSPPKEPQKGRDLTSSSRAHWPGTANRGCREKSALVAGEGSKREIDFGCLVGSSPSGSRIRAQARGHTSQPKDSVPLVFGGSLLADPAGCCRPHRLAVSRSGPPSAWGGAGTSLGTSEFRTA